MVGETRSCKAWPRAPTPFAVTTYVIRALRSTKAVQEFLLVRLQLARSVGIVEESHALQCILGYGNARLSLLAPLLDGDSRNLASSTAGPLLGLDRRRVSLAGHVHLRHVELLSPWAQRSATPAPRIGRHVQVGGHHCGQSRHELLDRWASRGGTASREVICAGVQGNVPNGKELASTILLFHEPLGQLSLPRKPHLPRGIEAPKGIHDAQERLHVVALARGAQGAKEHRLEHGLIFRIVRRRHGEAKNTRHPIDFGNTQLLHAPSALRVRVRKGVREKTLRVDQRSFAFARIHKHGIVVHAHGRQRLARAPVQPVQALAALARDIKAQCTLASARPLLLPLCLWIVKTAIGDVFWSILAAVLALTEVANVGPASRRDVVSRSRRASCLRISEQVLGILGCIRTHGPRSHCSRFFFWRNHRGGAVQCCRAPTRSAFHGSGQHLRHGLQSRSRLGLLVDVAAILVGVAWPLWLHLLLPFRLMAFAQSQTLLAAASFVRKSDEDLAKHSPRLVRLVALVPEKQLEHHLRKLLQRAPVRAGLQTNDGPISHANILVHAGGGSRYASACPFVRLDFLRPEALDA